MIDYSTQKNYASEKNLMVRKEFHRKYVVPSERIDNLIFNFLCLKGTEDIVDVGCGFGDVLIELKKKGHKGKLSGFDLSEAMIRKAKSKGRGISFHVANAQKLLLKNESCDVALFKHVLYHVQDIPKAIQEAHRILRPEGKLVITLNSVAFDSRKNIELCKAIIAKRIKKKYANTLKRCNLENLSRYTSKFNIILECKKYGYARLDDPLPFVDYMRSYREMYDPIPSPAEWEDAMTAVRAHVQKEIDRQGYFREVIGRGMVILTK